MASHKILSRFAQFPFTKSETELVLLSLGTECTSCLISCRTIFNLMIFGNAEFLENLKIENLPSRNKNMEIKLENWTKSATKLSMKDLHYTIL